MRLIVTKPLISVVVPVYNVERYVRRCIESIEYQTYQMLEIIIVDDGSTDSSGHICDELAAMFANIKVFHTTNGGLSAARNEGMRHVTGDYVCFVDSDDYLGEKHIQTLFETLTQCNTPMAVTGFTEVETSTSSEQFAKASDRCVVTLDASDAINESVKIGGRFASHAWGKLYSRSLFPQLKFPEGRLYEDQYVVYKIFFQAQIVAYEDTNDYYYTVKRKDSITENHVVDNTDFLTAVREELDFVKRNVPKSVDSVYTRYLMALMDAFNGSIRCGRPNWALFRKIKTNRSKALSRKYPIGSRCRKKYLLTLFGQRIYCMLVKLIH